VADREAARRFYSAFGVDTYLRLPECGRRERRNGAGRPRSAVNRQDEQVKILKFHAYVEPPDPMRGLEVPPEVVAALGGGARPPVTITVNGHFW
jgi:hypothetical protein